MGKKVSEQLTFPMIISTSRSITPSDLENILREDLDFHDKKSGYASHQFHSFPAKFPPQLPRKFIDSLTGPGDVVLDPMQGSGTTIIEAALTGRRALGFDIDPLAVLITKVKSTVLDTEKIDREGARILEEVEDRLKLGKSPSDEQLSRWDDDTRQFLDHWFLPETQIELFHLIDVIESVKDPEIRDFFKVIFSAIIITKSGGVSLALDLAHTRPHRAKLVLSKAGKVLTGSELTAKENNRSRHITKVYRNPIYEFRKRLRTNITGLMTLPRQSYKPLISLGNAQTLPIESSSVDLIVTSPPYASNAIDYMRAHKFSLVWFGFSLQELSKKRNEYIGSEASSGFEFLKLPSHTSQIISEISAQDAKKGRVLHRYYSEMTRTLREMFRVLKPGKSAIVVVGTSIMRGIDTETQICLAEIGREIGFEVPHIGIRNLDRDRRMLPQGDKIDRESQIQQRMHKEYVIGFYKPH